MLQITVPSNGQSNLTFTELVQLDLPQPKDGVRAEVDNDVILSFDDEQEAIDYTHLIERYAESLKDHNSLQYLALQDIIMAINNDEFVRSYLEGR